MRKFLSFSFQKGFVSNYLCRGSKGERFGSTFQMREDGRRSGGKGIDGRSDRIASRDYGLKKNPEGEKRLRSRYSSRFGQWRTLNAVTLLKTKKGVAKRKKSRAHSRPHC